MSSEAVTRKLILTILLIVVPLLLVGGVLLVRKQSQTSAINNFQQCQAAGFPVMESWPAQCRAGGRLFIQEIN